MSELICQHQDAIATVGAILWVATVVLRPFVPQQYVDALGKVGKAVEVLTGNTGTCKNGPVDKQDRVTPRK